VGQLTWNLRPEESGQVEWDSEKGGTRTLRLRGQIYMPDAYHRMMANVAAHEHSRSHGGGLSPNYRLNVLVHNVSAVSANPPEPSEEDRLFAAMNQQRTAADAPRVHYMAPKGAGLVAHSFVESCPHLGPAGNVEQVRNNLSIKNFRLFSYNTLVKALDSAWPDCAGASVADQAKIAAYLGRYWNALVLVRPELGLLALNDRQKVRRDSLVDSAGAIAGYLKIAFLLYTQPDTPDRFACLAKLAAVNAIEVPTTNGGTARIDFFDRRNPEFRTIGLMVPAPTQTDPNAWGLRNAKDAHERFHHLILTRVGLAPAAAPAP